MHINERGIIKMKPEIGRTANGIGVVDAERVSRDDVQVGPGGNTSRWGDG